MTKIGYLRVSTKDQKLGRQLQLLESQVEKLFLEKESGKTMDRPKLLQMLDYIREGDIVVITELDRLGRNNQDLTTIMNQIHDKGATLEVLNLPQMTGIADTNLRRLLNNLIIEIYKYQAEEERKKIKERQLQGISLAKMQGKYKGRQPLFKEDDPRLQLAFQLHSEGNSDKEIELKTGINRRTFARYRKKYKCSIE